MSFFSIDCATASNFNQQGPAYVAKETFAGSIIFGFQFHCKRIVAMESEAESLRRSSACFANDWVS